MRKLLSFLFSCYFEGHQITMGLINNRFRQGFLSVFIGDPNARDQCENVCAPYWFWNCWLHTDVHLNCSEKKTYWLNYIFEFCIGMKNVILVILIFFFFLHWYMYYNDWHENKLISKNIILHFKLVST